jgi:hypothetical protein
MAIMYVPESENEPRAQGGVQVTRRRKRRLAMPEERSEQTTFARMIKPSDTSAVMKKVRPKKY